MITIKQGHLYDHPEFGRVIATKNYTGHGVDLMECLDEDGAHVYPFISDLQPSPMKYFSNQVPE